MKVYLPLIYMPDDTLPYNMTSGSFTRYLAAPLHSSAVLLPSFAVRCLLSACCRHYCHAVPLFTVLLFCCLSCYCTVLVYRMLVRLAAMRFFSNPAALRYRKRG